RNHRLWQPKPNLLANRILSGEIGLCESTVDQSHRPTRISIRIREISALQQRNAERVQIVGVRHVKCCRRGVFEAGYRTAFDGEGLHPLIVWRIRCADYSFADAGQLPHPGGVLVTKTSDAGGIWIAGGGGGGEGAPPGSEGKD